MVRLIAVKEMAENRRTIYCVRADSEQEALTAIKKERGNDPETQDAAFLAEPFQPDVRFLREITGLTQKEFGIRYAIPRRTVQNWEEGFREMPEYVQFMLTQCVMKDIEEERTKSQAKVLFSFREE